MNNIDQFSFATSTIMFNLYESFPVPMNIDVRALKHELTNRFDQESSAKIDVYRHTFHFLKREGYVVNNDKEVKDSHIFRGAVLTAKGLATLNKIPNEIKDKSASTFADQLQEVKDKSLMVASNAGLTTIIRTMFS